MDTPDHPILPRPCLLASLPQAVDSSKEREELFEDWLDEKEKKVGCCPRFAPCSALPCPDAWLFLQWGMHSIVSQTGRTKKQMHTKRLGSLVLGLWDLGAQ